MNSVRSKQILSTLYKKSRVSSEKCLSYVESDRYVDQYARIILQKKRNGRGVNTLFLYISRRRSVCRSVNNTCTVTTQKYWFSNKYPSRTCPVKCEDQRRARVRHSEARRKRDARCVIRYNVMSIARLHRAVRYGCITKITMYFLYTFLLYTLFASRNSRS